MDRDLKFKAYDVKSGKMSEPFFVGWKQCDFGDFKLDVCNCRCKVIQFTGLHDKNGKEIYEGFILRYEHPKYKLGHETPYVISWDKEEAEFACENENNFMAGSAWKDMQIVGNIHENPELVEVC